VVYVAHIKFIIVTVGRSPHNRYDLVINDLSAGGGISEGIILDSPMSGIWLHGITFRYNSVCASRIATSARVRKYQVIDIPSQRIRYDFGILF
jgi:hypothetical protein